MIRAINKNDMDQVITIWLEASIKAHDFMDKEFWESKVQEMREVYIPSGDTYVFEDKGKVQGFISLCNDTIAATFVSPDMQGKGIGKKLIAKAKQIQNSIQLTVYKDNLASVEFYKKSGFKIVQMQTDPHTGHPELLMQFSA